MEKQIEEILKANLTDEKKLNFINEIVEKSKIKKQKSIKMNLRLLWTNYKHKRLMKNVITRDGWNFIYRRRFWDDVF